MNIFVAKLSPRADGLALRQLFEPFGEVSSAKVIMDRETGRSKCYGFVEMENDEQAQTAIQALNNTEQEGSTIVVKESTPRGERREFRPRRENYRSDRY